jgi:hypothetical protein
VSADPTRSADILACLLKKQGDIHTPVVYAPSKVFESSSKPAPLPKRVRWMCDKILKTFYPRLHVDDFEDFLFKEDNGKNKERIMDFLQGRAGERLYVSFDVVIADEKVGSNPFYECSLLFLGLAIAIFEIKLIIINYHSPLFSFTVACREVDSERDC